MTLPFIQVYSYTNIPFQHALQGRDGSTLTLTLMEIGMLALGRMMSGRGTESCTMHQGIGSRVHGQMMPCTVLGYITSLTGIGWRGNGGRASVMAAAPSTGPMETGRRTSIGRANVMGAAPPTRPTVQFRLQECSGVIGHGVCGVL